MGDWYEFNFIEVNGEWVSGAVFQNRETNYNEKQIQLTEKQKLLVNAWVEKQEALGAEKDSMIKSFIKELTLEK